jgi:hypothetical protein
MEAEQKASAGSALLSFPKIMPLRGRVTRPSGLYGALLSGHPESRPERGI